MFGVGFLSMTVIHFLLVTKTFEKFAVAKLPEIRSRIHSKMDHEADWSSNLCEGEIEMDRIGSTLRNNCIYRIDEEIKRTIGSKIDWIKGPLQGPSTRKVREMSKDTNDFPCIINILRIDKDNYYLHCAASFISPVFLLTAAHCLYHPITRLRLPIEHLAAIYVSSQDDSTNVITVINIHQHKCYRPHSLHNDIAVLRIKSTLTSCKATTLPQKLDESLEVLQPELTFARINTMKGLSRLSNVLQIVQIPYVALAECRVTYKRLKFDPELIVDRMHLCGGGLYKIAPCKGDSGGPIIANGVQVGLVSWAAGCGIKNVPDVFTRIDTYMPWILKIVNERREIINFHHGIVK